MKIRYRLRPGSRLKTSAEVVGARIEAIKSRKGYVTAADVVEDATDPGSPIHEEFDWDVDRAARKHWEARARQLLTSYVVTIEVVKDVPRTEPLIANVQVVKENVGRCYVSTSVAMANPDMREQVMRDARRLLEGIRARIERLEGADDIIRDIERLRAKIGRRIGAGERIPAP